MSHALVLDITLPLGRFTLSVQWETTCGALGVFGPSGAGKTSLLEAVAGLRRQARGTIRVADQVWLDSSRGVNLPPEDRGVGYVPQDALLFPHRNVLGNLLMGRRRAEGSRARRLDPQRVLQVLELSGLQKRDVASLSGGERQRVALGRALCSGPALLLMDEPLAGLDAPLRRRILPYMLRVRDEFAIPALHVSHDPSEVAILADEVSVLHAGSVVARGKPDSVFTNPVVLPMARAEGFENLLHGKVLQVEAATAVVELEPGLEIVATGKEMIAGRETVIGLRAEELILATGTPSGLSAQNILAGRVEEIRETGDIEDGQPQVLVVVIAGARGIRLVSAVTRQACRQLGLAAGMPVSLVFKAQSCRAIAAR